MDIVDGLHSLVARNLLVREPSDSPETRFTMLETIRDFALEQLDAQDERLVAEDNHAKFCRELAEAAEPELLRSGSHAWIVRLENEMENFRAVVRQASCSGRPEVVVEALRLIGALWWFCRQRAHLREAHEWTELLLPLYLARDAVRGWALLTAYFGWELHDASTARARATEALAIAREVGDERLAGLSLVVRALVSEPSDSVRFLNEAVSTFRQIGDEWGLARALLHIALLQETSQARRSLSEAGAIFERIGHNEGVGSVHRHFGNLALREGKLDDAECSYRQALSYWKAADYRTYLPAVTLSLGDVALRSGHPLEARVHFEEALRLATELGSRRHIEQASARLAGLSGGALTFSIAVRERPGGLTERQLEVAPCWPRPAAPTATLPKGW
jgi:tetratricopeptide (TPR) repeat protein